MIQNNTTSTNSGSFIKSVAKAEYDHFLLDFRLGTNEFREVCITKDISEKLCGLVVCFEGYGSVIISTDDLGQTCSFTYPNGNAVFEAKIERYADNRYKVYEKCTSNYRVHIYVIYIIENESV